MKLAVWQFARVCRLLAIPFAVAIGVGWLVQGFDSPVAVRVSNGGLVVNADDLQLGEVWEQGQLQRSIRIANPTSRRIQVDWMQTSCTCTSVEPRTFALEPGDEQSVRVTLDLRPREVKFADEGATDQPRDFEVGLYPQVSASCPVKKEEWTIVGKLRRPFLFEEKIVDFGDVSNAQRPGWSKTFRVKCLSPVESFTASCDPERAVVEALPPRDGSDWREIRVSMAQEFPLGRFDFELNLEPTSAVNGRLPAVPVRVTGRMVEDIQIMPPEVTFGSVRLGEPVSETVTLRSLTGRPFVIQSTESTIDGVTVTTSDQANTSAGCRMVVRPAQAGANSGRVKFNVTSGGRSISVPLRMSYVGLYETKGLSQTTAHQSFEKQGS